MNYLKEINIRDLFSQDWIFIRLVFLWIHSGGCKSNFVIFCLVKDFIFIVAKYVFLMYTVPVPRLKSINQYNTQFTHQIVDSFSFKIKTTLHNELSKNFERIFFRIGI